MSKLKQTIIAGIISATVLVFVIVVLSYVSNINQILTDITINDLVDHVNTQQEDFNSQMLAEITSLERVSTTLETFSSIENSEETYEYLNDVQHYSLFDTLFAVNVNGIGTNHKGEVVDISNEDYFQDTINGKIIVTEPRQSVDNSDENVIVITMPLYYMGTVEGVLAAEYSLSSFSESIYFDASEAIYIVSGDSRVVLDVKDVSINQVLENKYLSDTFKDAIFEKGEYEDFVFNINASKSGGATINVEGNELNVEYRPLNVNDWMLVATVDSDFISGDVQNIIQMISILTIGIIFVFMALIGYVFVSRQNYIKDIEQVAYYDDLTGLPNINKFKIDVKEMLKKNTDVEFGIVKLDIVNFKTINVMYDFDIGNKVIKAIAGVLIDARYGDEYLVARVGTDEFLLFSKAFILKDLDNAKYIYEAAFKRKLPTINEHNVEFRYGRYILDKGEMNIESVIDKVTLAHANSKGKSSDIIYDYDETVEKLIIKQTEIQNKMFTALETDEFKTHLQPKFDIQTNEIAGAEALVRWVEKDGNMIFPNDFISVFENNGFIVNVDIYIFTTVCKKIEEWKKLNYKIVPISVNFSRLHFYNENFIDELVYITNKYNVKRDLIEIEITESVMFDNEEKMLETTQKLRSQGFKVSIDDFGSGYSSLGQLKNIAVDVVKIDRSFFLKSDDEEKGNLVVGSTIDMLHKLNLKTVAEGVETKEQVNFLKEIGCELGQGYFFSKPIPIKDFEENFIKR